VLFLIEHGSRKVHVAGATTSPTESWVTQQARQLAWVLGERSVPARGLIRDRDARRSNFAVGNNRLFRGRTIALTAVAAHSNAVLEPR